MPFRRYRRLPRSPRVRACFAPRAPSFPASPALTHVLVDRALLSTSVSHTRARQRAVQNEGNPIILTGAGALNKASIAASLAVRIHRLTPTQPWWCWRRGRGAQVLGREVYSSNLQLGGTQIMYSNGVSHLTAKDDYSGVLAILNWLSYARPPPYSLARDVAVAPAIVALTRLRWSRAWFSMRGGRPGRHPTTGLCLRSATSCRLECQRRTHSIAMYVMEFLSHAAPVAWFPRTEHGLRSPSAVEKKNSGTLVGVGGVVAPARAIRSTLASDGPARRKRKPVAARTDGRRLVCRDVGRVCRSGVCAAWDRGSVGERV